MAHWNSMWLKENTVLMTVHLFSIGRVAVDTYILRLFHLKSNMFHLNKTVQNERLSSVNWKSDALDQSGFIYRRVVCWDECSSKHQPKSKDLNQFKRIELKSNIKFSRRARVGISNDWKNFHTHHTHSLIYICTSLVDFFFFFIQLTRRRSR